ncbi:hypothetical protein [Lentzea sp. NBRC 102530]|uniref:hypothetical protein n=1 Tax=Lentzea sp. NBRC 102530 TaxID=3032201 RepID=UPI002555151C|nr:hypothetical protein [Lentzea sp. NBRC 102530]
MADKFMRAWVTHPSGMTSDAWAAQMKDFAQPELMDRLKSVDPANIRASAVVAAPVLVDKTDAVVTADVKTDKDTVRVIVLKQSDGTWRVRSYDQAGT